MWGWDVQGNKYLDCLSDLTKSFPPELLESDNGVGVYFNPDEGQEIMREFYDIINGLKKNGIKWPDRGARR